MRPAASIVIPTWNRARILQLSLPRFLNQTLSADEYEVVIVDDGSDDDTQQVIRAHARPNLVFDRQTMHRSLAPTKNRAVELARGRILIFVDDDAFVRPDFVAQHLESHREGRAMVVTGPILDVREPPMGSIA